MPIRGNVKQLVFFDIVENEVHQHLRESGEILGRLGIVDLKRHVAAEQLNVFKIILKRSFVESAFARGGPDKR